MARSKKLYVIQATVLLPLLALLSLPGVSLAQGQAQVYVLPPGGAAIAGQPMTVDVVAEGVSNLYGAEIHLRFDPAMVRLEDADPSQEGMQLTPGTLLQPAQGFIVANRADNQAGTAVFAVTLVNPASPVAGNGVVARIAFVPLQPGTLRFNLEKVKLVTRDLKTLDVATTGLEVAVGGQSLGQAAAPVAAPPLPAGQTSEQASQAPSVESSAAAVGVPIWGLVLVALAMVSIPLVGVWLLLGPDIMERFRSNIR